MQVVRKDLNFLLLPSDIRWHFIGALQSKKLKGLIALSHLHLIETLDDETKARKLNTLLAAASRTLEVYIQVNTSREGAKRGVLPEETIPLADFVTQHCPNLHLTGLMTIGSTASSSQDMNPDFAVLAQCRQQVAEHLGVPVESLELSMGMSQDYVHAVLGLLEMHKVTIALFRYGKDPRVFGLAVQFLALVPWMCDYNLILSFQKIILISRLSNHSLENR